MRNADSAIATLVVLAILWSATAPVAGGAIGAGEWIVVRITGRPASADAGTLRFENDRVSGKAACNRFLARLASGPSGGRLELGTIGATRMHCEGRMETERALLDALAAVRTYRLDADVLLLQDAEGKPLVTLSR